MLLSYSAQEAGSSLEDGQEVQLCLLHEEERYPSPFATKSPLSGLPESVAGRPPADLEECSSAPYSGRQTVAAQFLVLPDQA